MRFLPRYNAPMTQIVLVSFVCFATVGMYSAISNLGAGGTQNIKLSDQAHVTLYTMFAVGGVFAGSVNNVLGPRWTLFIGTFGYAIYVSALWVYQTTGVSWYLIFAGALQGLGAALLWAAEGAIMMSYPVESEKGRAFSTFWVIFNAGSLTGGLIALGINIGQGALSATAKSTYVAFFVIIVSGILLSLTILPPAKVIRADGTAVKVQSYLTAAEELREWWKALRQMDLVLLLPMFFASNYFYTYQQAFAVALFDTQTRALNAVVKALGQIVGAVTIGILLDKLPVARRRDRGLLGIAITFCFIAIAWSWGLKYQLGFTRATKIKKMHWDDPRFAEPISILALYDIGDAMFQGLAYWIMGALTNDPFKLARLAGLYKAVQSCGAAVAFGVDSAVVLYLNEHLSSWLLLLISFPPAIWVTIKVRDSNYQVERNEREHETTLTRNGVHDEIDDELEKAHKPVIELAEVSMTEKATTRR